jgi:Reverse transcriptase (RNA-dependent DNA polymerase)
VQLQKALYGCIQSAVLWCEELFSTLEGLGYSKNPYDTCVFNKFSEGLKDTTLLDVDDLVITSKRQSVLNTVAAALRTRYGGVTIRSGQQHNVLGIGCLAK